MAGKKRTSAPAEQTQPSEEAQSQESTGRKRWVKLTPRDHVLKQIEAQETLVEGLRKQLEKEEKTLQGMQKAKEFFPE